MITTSFADSLCAVKRCCEELQDPNRPTVNAMLLVYVFLTCFPGPVKQATFALS